MKCGAGFVASQEFDSQELARLVLYTPPHLLGRQPSLD